MSYFFFVQYSFEQVILLFSEKGLCFLRFGFSLDDNKGNAVKEILYLNVLLKNDIQTFSCSLLSIKNPILIILQVVFLPKTFLLLGQAIT